VNALVDNLNIISHQNAVSPGIQQVAEPRLTNCQYLCCFSSRTSPVWRSGNSSDTCHVTVWSTWWGIGTGGGRYWAGRATARALFGPYAPKRSIEVEMGRKCPPSFQMLPPPVGIGGWEVVYKWTIVSCIFTRDSCTGRYCWERVLAMGILSVCPSVRRDPVRIQGQVR